jgi:RecB family exonuclease
MRDQTSLAEALWRSVVELRLAGLRSEQITPEAFAAADKHDDLTALARAYERHLDTHRIADAAAVFAEADQRMAYCPIHSDDVMVVWPETIWPPLVQGFLDVLPGRRRPWPLAEVPRLVPPRRVSMPSTADGAPADKASSRLRYLMAPDLGPRDPVQPADDSLQIFHAGGREAEIDEVCRRIVARGVPLDDVEIACGSEAHALLVWEKALRLGWPVTLASGVPATLTHPGRALLAWCDWIERDFAATRLRRLLQSGDVAPVAWRRGEEDDGAMTAGQGARLLLRAEAAWGRQTYAPAFARLRAFYRARASSEDRDAAQRARDAVTLKRLDRLEQWVGDALASVPNESETGTIDLQALLLAAREFLGQAALRASVLDASALVVLDDSLSELGALGALRVTLPAGLRFVRERVRAQRVGADRARPGHLYVSALETAGLSGRGLLCVVGLEEGRVFPAATEDPVLLDVERAALSPALRLAADRLDEAVWRVVRRLATAGREATHGVCLSFSCRDTREFRETFPSWIVLQAFRLLRSDPTLGYGDLSTWLGEPLSSVPPRADRAITRSGWWLAHARTASSETRLAALTAFSDLARGLQALSARATTAFTPWDGHVPIAGPVLDVTRRGRPVSPSTLEDAAACPFRFFLRSGLSVEPLEEERRYQDAWLDGLTRGRELHDLFARAMRDIRAEGRQPNDALDVPRVLARGRHRLDELKALLPPPSEQVFQIERDEFLHDLHLFMTAECRRSSGADAIAFEVSFGLPLDDPEVEPLAIGQPVALEIAPGQALEIRGRIDRIDRLPDGTFETIDYKTGGYWDEDWQGTFAGGTRLQHALYGVAAEMLLARRFRRPRVARGSYVFPSARGQQRRKTIPTPAPGELAAVLGELTTGIARGAFVQAVEAKACRWCQFAPACGERPWERARPKCAAAEELRWYRDLKGHP